MTGPDPDRLRYAQIAGAAARHAHGWRLTAAEEAAAIAELAQAAAGRADLLAERAGTALGFGEGRPDAARYQQIAELCIAAGADRALIERWIKVGRERAAAAAAIPYTGLPPGGLMPRHGAPRAPSSTRQPGFRPAAARARAPRDAADLPGSRGWHVRCGRCGGAPVVAGIPLADRPAPRHRIASAQVPSARCAGHDTSTAG
jgi:hypothetical protein